MCRLWVGALSFMLNFHNNDGRIFSASLYYNFGLVYFFFFLVWREDYQSSVCQYVICSIYFYSSFLLFRREVFEFLIVVLSDLFLFLLFLFLNIWPDAWEKQQLCNFPSRVCQCIYLAALDVIKIIVYWKNWPLQLFQNNSRWSLMIGVSKNLKLMRKNDVLSNFLLFSSDHFENIHRNWHMFISILACYALYF